jgi:hypothetical protein
LITPTCVSDHRLQLGGKCLIERQELNVVGASAGQIAYLSEQHRVVCPWALAGQPFQQVPSVC